MLRAFTDYAFDDFKCSLNNHGPYFLSDVQVTFDDFKEGFVAVLSQAIEQLSSSEDEDQPSDSTAGAYLSICHCPLRVWIMNLNAQEKGLHSTLKELLVSLDQLTIN